MDNNKRDVKSYRSIPAGILVGISLIIIQKNSTAAHFVRAPSLSHYHIGSFVCHLITEIINIKEQWHLSFGDLSKFKVTAPVRLE